MRNKTLWFLITILIFLGGYLRVQHLERKIRQQDLIIQQISQGNKISILGKSDTLENPQVRPAIEWLNDNEFVIYKGCGTECELAYIFATKGNFKSRLSYGVKYLWSPNKKYVLAYQYALQSGITVGDKFGNRVFTLKREYPKKIRVAAHKASWSKDSTKLSLIINKNQNPDLELLVFDVVSGFRILKQQELDHQEFSDLGWMDDNTMYYTSAGEKFYLRI